MQKSSPVSTRRFERPQQQVCKVLADEGEIMPRFDFKCPTCRSIVRDVWISTPPSPGQLHRTCSHCGTELEKLPSAPNFVVKGYNAKNGYSSE
jgi:predicted nucleic acid-binding Zn ribbon protein